MKTTKMIALVALFAAGLTFTSCKKTYTCDCAEFGGGKTEAKLNASDGKTYKSNCETAGCKAS